MHTPLAATTKRPPTLPQLQRSADAIGRTLANELPKLNPTERRELLVQTMEWIRGRVAALDESRRRSTSAIIVEPTAEETKITTGAFGKGIRSSDLAEAAQVGFAEPLS